MQKLSLVAVASFLLVATGAQNAAAAPLGDTTQTIQPAITSLLKTIKDPERRQEIHAATPVLTSVLNDMACTPSIPGPISSNHQQLTGELMRYATSSQATANYWSPFDRLPNTPQTACLGVSRLQNIQFAGKNEFTLSATFCSSISGLCAPEHLGFVNMGQGWQLKCLDWTCG